MENTSISKKVGETLRYLRHERGLSLEELSSRIGISKLTLGNIERGEGNPTLAVIWKIANGLKVPVSSLLDVEPDVSIAPALNSKMQIVSANEAFFVQPLFHSANPATFETYRAHLLPESSYRSEAHPAGVSEYVTVMTGRLVMQVGTESYELDTHDSIRFHAQTEHTYKNPGTEMTTLHIVISYPGAVSVKVF